MLARKSLVGIHLMLGSLMLMGSQLGWSADPGLTQDLVIENAFIPALGYDDNNQIEVVIQGTLPNFCYSIDSTDRVSRSGNVFQLQTQVLPGDPLACAEKRASTGVVPFNFVLALGQLAVGDYEFRFTTSHGPSSVHFNVRKAAWMGVDEENYASITGVTIDRVLIGNREVFADVDGLLVSNCSELIRPIQVQRQGNVFVVLPIADLKPGRSCSEVRRPFREKISLGFLDPGSYLLHVRSREGKAVLRVFTVGS